MLTLFLVTSILFLRSEEIKADTTAKSNQGVFLKSTQLKVDKVIYSPTSSSAADYRSDVSRESEGTNDMISYAYNFIGIPYVYGANGPNSFDCSGFTRYIYSNFLINIPRTSQSQYYSGTKVEQENIQQGDLVFFNTDTTLGHVGMYIGNGEFIHASSSKGVTVSSLNDGYYSSRYAGAVRY